MNYNGHTHSAVLTMRLTLSLKALPEVTLKDLILAITSCLGTGTKLEHSLTVATGLSQSTRDDERTAATLQSVTGAPKFIVPSNLSELSDLLWSGWLKKKLRDIEEGIVLFTVCRGVEGRQMLER